MKKIFLSISIGWALQTNISLPAQQCFTASHIKSIISPAKSNYEKRKAIRHIAEHIVAHAMIDLSQALQRDDKKKNLYEVINHAKARIRHEFSCTHVSEFTTVILDHFNLSTLDEALDKALQEFNNYLNGIIDRTGIIKWGGAWYIAYFDSRQCFSYDHIKKLGESAESDEQARATLKGKFETLLAFALKLVGEYVLNPKKDTNLALQCCARFEMAIERELTCSDAEEAKVRILEKFGFKNCGKLYEFAQAKFDEAIDNVINNFTEEWMK